MPAQRIPHGALVLQTERLLLRRLTLEDLDALAALYADPEVRRYFPEGTLTREETREELEWIIDVYYARFGYGLWATIERQTGELIGRCGLLPWKIVRARSPEHLALDGADERPNPADDHEVELAYLLAKERWGHGLATEASLAIVDHAFEHLGVRRLICLVDRGNEASLAVARKVGMVAEGSVEVDGELLPLLSLSRTRWSTDRGRNAPGAQGRARDASEEGGPPRRRRPIT
ncbi:MAG TPA: GNAT family N-acetyltransferase [Actinomycetota bacterium]|jgi:ribosomal-protein-alanine N-acetyltransferase